jgi:hypothetical protein
VSLPLGMGNRELISRYSDPGFHKHVNVAKILGLTSELSACEGPMTQLT